MKIFYDSIEHWTFQLNKNTDTIIEGLSAQYTRLVPLGLALHQVVVSEGKQGGLPLLRQNLSEVGEREWSRSWLTTSRVRALLFKCFQYCISE